MFRSLVVGIGKLLHPLFSRNPKIVDIKKICVFKTGAMGDILLSTAFISALRNQFPNSQIDYWVGDWAAGVLDGNTNVNNVHRFDPKFTYGGYAKTLPKILGLAKRVRNEKYDLMFSLDKDYLAVCFGRILCRPRIHVGFDRHGEGFANTISVPYRTDLRKHEILYYMDLIEVVNGTIPKEPRMELYLTEEQATFAVEWMRMNTAGSQVVGVAPTGGNPGQSIRGRKWEYAKWIKVIQGIERLGYKVVLFGGPNDYVELDKMASETNGIVAKTPSLLHAAALMKHCRALVCIDSALMHVGAALDIPVVSVFGMTDPIRKAPMGTKHKYVWHPMECQKAEVFAVYSESLLTNIDSITVREVMAAVKSIL